MNDFLKSLLLEMVPTLQWPALTTIFIASLMAVDRSWIDLLDKPGIGMPVWLTALVFGFLMLFTSMQMDALVLYLCCRLVGWLHAETQEKTPHLR